MLLFYVYWGLGGSLVEVEAVEGSECVKGFANRPAIVAEGAAGGLLMRDGRVARLKGPESEAKHRE